MVHPEAEELTVATPSLRMSLGSQKLFAAIAIFAIVVGPTMAAMGWVVLRLRRATVVLA